MGWTSTSEEINDLKEQIKALESELRAKDFQMQQISERNKQLEKQIKAVKADNEFVEKMWEREYKKRRAKNA